MVPQAKVYSYEVSKYTLDSSNYSIIFVSQIFYSISLLGYRGYITLIQEYPGLKKVLR